MQEGDELCLEAADLMLTILGAEAGHMGIRLLATGGVFLAGAHHCAINIRQQSAVVPLIAACHI